MSFAKGPVFIQFGKAGRKPGLFSVLIALAMLALLFVAGVWLLMIAATLVVLSLPYLWWKRRQMMGRFTESMQQATQGQQSESRGSGMIIEGEVIQSTEQSDKSIQ